MKRICVFCGSSSGDQSLYRETAFRLGEAIGERGFSLVYGGANVGLMGAVAEGTLSKGGQVIGVLPNFLQKKEIAHTSLTELLLVESMHERKSKMNELSDGVIALPGGFGTMEELFEVLTWSQLGLLEKPIALLNLNGFYEPLLLLLDQMVKSGFLKQENKEMLLVANSISHVLDQMLAYSPKHVTKWIEPTQI
ncbi:hypothetical protein LPTSP4_14090 [Leptospira ryugenii]|uniref:Cytokinin riboside 5'-monophosphate phosphoribohydrolase n=2 Tax=Leptospira ryugenii TaxID=1917863 RepID=A0A2P2DZ35_9LEPT|nr:hypothetical protein LPTSP4_14090 [Leptospira ryugenii]